MKWPAKTLWHLLGVNRTKRPPPPRSAEPDRSATRSAMQDRYDALVDDMKRQHGIRVRKWRSSTSGCAWTVRYQDGRVTKLIESPYPRGPMSCAIFLHEVGHHAIGLGAYKPRCLEEYHAWCWALMTMRAAGFNVTAAVEKRMADAMEYAIYKARKRGLKTLPPELVPFDRKLAIEI